MRWNLYAYGTRDKKDKNQERRKTYMSKCDVKQNALCKSLGASGRWRQQKVGLQSTCMLDSINKRNGIQIWYRCYSYTSYRHPYCVINWLYFRSLQMQKYYFFCKTSKVLVFFAPSASFLTRFKEKNNPYQGVWKAGIRSPAPKSHNWGENKAQEKSNAQHT